MKEKKCDTVLFIKLPKDLKDKAQQQADKNFKTLSDYVRDLIIKDSNKNNI